MVPNWGAAVPVIGAIPNNSYNIVSGGIVNWLAIRNIF